MTSQNYYLDIDRNLSKKIFIDEIIEEYKLVNLESNGDDYIGEVSKVVCFKNFIYVLDGRQGLVLKFSSEGKYFGPIGKRGTNLGEYLSADDFDIDELGMIYVLSNANWGYVKYSSDGKFITEKRFPFAPSYISIVSPTEIGLYTAYYEEENYNLVFTDDQGMAINKLFPYPKELSNMTYSFTGNLVRNDNKILYADATSCKIHMLASKEDCIRSNSIFEINLGKYAYNCETPFQFEKFSKEIRDFDNPTSYLTKYFGIANDYLIFKYADKRTMKNALYNINNGDLFTQDNFNENLTKEVLKYSPTKGTINGKFIFSIDYEFCDYRKANIDHLFKNKSQIESEIKEVILNQNDSKNPVLIFIKFKQQ